MDTFSPCLQALGLPKKSVFIQKPKDASGIIRSPRSEFPVARRSRESEARNMQLRPEISAAGTRWRPAAAAFYCTVTLRFNACVLEPSLRLIGTE